MTAKSHNTCSWRAYLLILAVGLSGPALFAQAPTDPADTPQKQTADQDKKPAPAKNEAKTRQPDLGVAVDSARKSDALATWMTTEHNEGETGGPWVIKQSAEFGG